MSTNGTWVDTRIASADDGPGNPTRGQSGKVLYWRWDARSASGHFEVDPPLPDGMPSGLTATPFNYTQMTLNWTNGSTNEDGFSVQKSSDGESWENIGYDDEPGATTGLFDAEWFYPYFKIAAFTENLFDNDHFLSDYAVSDGIVDFSGLDAPSGLGAEATGSDVTLTWDAWITAYATIVRIYRSADSGATWTLAHESTDTTWTDTGLAAGTYQYRLKFANVNSAPASNTVEVIVS